MSTPAVIACATVWLIDRLTGRVIRAISARRTAAARAARETTP